MPSPRRWWRGKRKERERGRGGASGREERDREVLFVLVPVGL